MMFFVSDIFTPVPEQFGTPPQETVYGIRSKLQAASLATAQEIDTVITNGKAPHARYNIVRDANVGTLFIGRCGK